MTDEAVQKHSGPIYFVRPEATEVLPKVQNCTILTYTELLQGINVQDIAYMTYIRGKLPSPESYPRTIDEFRLQLFANKALAKAYFGMRLPRLAPLGEKLAADFIALRAQAKTSSGVRGFQAGSAAPKIPSRAYVTKSRPRPRQERPQLPSKRRAIEYRRPTPEPMDVDPVNWAFVLGREPSPPFSLTTTAGPASPRSEDLGDIGGPNSDDEMEDSDLWDLRTALQAGLVAVNRAGGLIWIQRGHGDGAIGLGRIVEFDPVDMEEEERRINDGLEEQPKGEAEHDEAEDVDGSDREDVDDDEWEDIDDDGWEDVDDGEAYEVEDDDEDGWEDIVDGNQGPEAGKKISKIKVNRKDRRWRRRGKVTLEKGK